MIPLLAVVFLLSFTAFGGAAPVANSSNATGCRCFPGDSCRPSVAEWNQFNETVGGKLIATVPIGSVCHDSSFGSFDREACDALRAHWIHPDTHFPSSSSIMAPFFANNSCNPFLPAGAPCTLGNYVSFAVNASDTSDFQTTIQFVRQHNIRLVIRNTGHDYLGKSTGAGAVAIWTHHMKDMDIVDYKSPSYTGKAMKIGAGVQVKESYQYTGKHGYINVGGDCQSVGVTGGYTQGGGHGPGASKFGPAADQALEWEVVTGKGEVLTANREQNEDLYWALSGGGGGTYGVVSSLTAKIYPDLMNSAANLTFPIAGVNNDSFWDVVETFHANSPGLFESGCFSIWGVDSTDGFMLYPANCPGLSKANLRKLFEPTFEKLEQHNISYQFSAGEFSNFYDSYHQYNVRHEIGAGLLGSRLIPRDVLDQKNTELTQAIRRMVEAGATFGVTANNISRQGFPLQNNSVDPKRRQMVFSTIFNLPYNERDYSADIDRANRMTEQLLPMTEKLTPDGRAYMNEADFQQPDWQKVFYGENYNRLLQIKDKYDPDQIFFAITAVGSDRWYQNDAAGGRLCRVS